LDETNQPLLHPDTPLIKIMALANSSHQLIQQADPKLGEDCWICLRAREVSYASVGLTNMSEMHRLGMDNSTQPDSTCLTGPAVQIIGETKCSGKGKCCADLVKGAKAPNRTYFACQSRIHTCYLGGDCALVFLVQDLDILPGTEVAQYLNQQSDIQTCF
jgi:hypothetical protein